MNKLYEGLAEILEVEPEQVTRDLRLEEVSWDSMAIVSTIALFDEVYDQSVDADALGGCETVGDIEDLAGRGASGGA
ncbi:MAG TPA: acyl carrier protein [Allosphingosinicella sp.]|jgi:acyl carrier protein